MIGTIIVFAVGVVVGAAGRTQIAEAAQYIGNTIHDIVKPKSDDPPRK